MGVHVDVGRNRITEILVGEEDHSISQMGVGTGSASESTNDASLDNEVYRGSVTDTSVEIADTSTVGQIEAQITVRGGTEVPADTSISEIGIFVSDGTLLYRKVFPSPTTVASGESATFTVQIDLLTQ